MIVAENKFVVYGFFALGKNEKNNKLFSSTFSRSDGHLLNLVYGLFKQYSMAGSRGRIKGKYKSGISPWFLLGKQHYQISVAQICPQILSMLTRISIYLWNMLGFLGATLIQFLYQKEIKIKYQSSCPYLIARKNCWKLSMCMLLEAKWMNNNKFNIPTNFLYLNP